MLKSFASVTGISFAFLVCLPLCNVAAFAGPPAHKPPAVQDEQQKHHHRGLFKGMTPEQKLMWNLDVGRKTRGRPREERRAIRLQIRDEWAAMTPSQRQLAIADLDRRWNAMPQDRRQRLMQKAQERRERFLQKRDKLTQSP